MSKTAAFRRARALVLVPLLFALAACSGADLQRMGYETVRGAQREQCAKDRTSECKPMGKYEDYQKEREKI